MKLIVQYFPRSTHNLCDALSPAFISVNFRGFNSGGKRRDIGMESMIEYTKNDRYDLISRRNAMFRYAAKLLQNPCATGKTSPILTRHSSPGVCYLTHWPNS